MVSRRKAIKVILEYRELLKELAPRHIEIKRNQDKTITFWDNRDGFEIITIPEEKINEYPKEVILAYRHELESKKRKISEYKE